MTRISFNNKTTLAALVAAAVLAIALIGSWLLFLSSPAQPQLSQEQLRALAAQAAKHGGKNGRDADPYKDEAVKNAVRKQALEIQKPWLAYLGGKPKKTEGTVALDWTIAADGKATQVAVVHSDFENAAFNEGVRAAMAAIVFPPPPRGQPYYVTHQLNFKQEPHAL
jgi:TonB family protein